MSKSNNRSYFIGMDGLCHLAKMYRVQYFVSCLRKQEKSQEEVPKDLLENLEEPKRIRDIQREILLLYHPLWKLRKKRNLEMNLPTKVSL